MKLRTLAILFAAVVLTQIVSTVTAQCSGGKCGITRKK